MSTSTVVDFGAKLIFVLLLGFIIGVVSVAIYKGPVPTLGHATVTLERDAAGRWRCARVEGDVEAARRATEGCP